jgi:hypothetical protein
MTYSGTKEAVKSALQGIAVNINVRSPAPPEIRARAFGRGLRVVGFLKRSFFI